MSPPAPATLATACAVGVAILAGAWAGRIVASGEDAPPPVSRVVQAGPARLVVPAHWRPARAGIAALARLDRDRTAVLSAVPGLSTRVVVTLGAAAGPSLVPRPLRAVVGALPPARPASLGGRPAWIYRALELPGSRHAMDVTVLPTTAGMLAVACTAPVYISLSSSDCGSAVESVSVRGAATLAPSGAVAVASRLEAALAPLDRARVQGRVELRRARTNAAQALAARGLARRHLATADALHTTFGAPARSLVDRLERSGRAYAALGAAAREGSADRFHAAGIRVQAAESRLASAVQDVLRRGGHRTTGATRPTSGDPPAPSSQLGQIALVILVLLASGVAGFILSEPVGGAAGRLARRLPSAP